MKAPFIIAFSKKEKKFITALALVLRKSKFYAVHFWTTPILAYILEQKNVPKKVF